MYATNQFRKGLKIELEGQPYIIVDFQHVKPGKGNAFVRTKMKNLLTGNNLEKTFRSGEKVGVPDLEENKMVYLYNDGNFHFMDTTSYEQVMIPEENLGDAVKFLKEETEASILFYKGSAIAVELPNFINYTIVQTDPGVKGDTVTGGTKPAEIETGAIIQVPLFINEGERIRVDTRTGDYVERVKG